MSDTTEQNDAAAEATGNEIQITILGQYIKDLSFENPTPAQTIQKLSTEQPSMNINVNLNAQQVGEDIYEVDLKVTATAQSNEETAFVAELLYSGLFGIKNLPENQLQPFLMVEAPRQIFPFARRILSDVTRDGGFPPLMLEPIDFAGLYQQQLAQANAQNEATPDSDDDIVVN
jgi:preprotein translocase subunit SecB